MAKFFSKEWLELFKEEVNRSEAFANAARIFNDSFIFIVDPDESFPTFPKQVAVYVELVHGKCLEITMLSSPSDRKAAYTYQATYGNWKRIIDGVIHPIKGVVTGNIHVEGNMPEFLNRRRAAEELVLAARRVPTEFERAEIQKAQVPA
jgi:putative sterol carrier protein